MINDANVRMSKQQSLFPLSHGSHGQALDISCKQRPHSPSITDTIAIYADMLSMLETDWLTRIFNLGIHDCYAASQNSSKTREARPIYRAGQEISINLLNIFHFLSVCSCKTHNATATVCKGRKDDTYIYFCEGSSHNALHLSS